MPNPDLANDSILWKYQERSGDPGFWAEPLNALSNLAFVVAALMAWRLAVRKQAITTSSRTQIGFAALVGLGSFVFHTLPNQLTLWLDILPILIFQVCFIWTLCIKLLRLGPMATVLILLVVIGSALILRPVKQPMNGSLFYLPPLLTLLLLGWAWAERNKREPWLLFAAAVCFALAVTARSIDWSVDLDIGTHFMWHLMNGVVLYLSLRTVVLIESPEWTPFERPEELASD